MDINNLLKEGRDIWEKKETLTEIVPRMGKVFGDICKCARNARPDDYNEYELKKEMGNIIFSTIRWCNDLGFDPEECINLAKVSQRKFPKN
jgi:hypothetical protein